MPLKNECNLRDARAAKFAYTLNFNSNWFQEQSEQSKYREFMPNFIRPFKVYGQMMWSKRIVYVCVQLKSLCCTDFPIDLLSRRERPAITTKYLFYEHQIQPAAHTLISRRTIYANTHSVCVMKVVIRLIELCASLWVEKCVSISLLWRCAAKTDLLRPGCGKSTTKTGSDSIQTNRAWNARKIEQEPTVGPTVSWKSRPALQ